MPFYERQSNHLLFKAMTLLLLFELSLGYGSRALRWVNRMLGNDSGMESFLFENGKLGTNLIVYTFLLVVVLCLFGGVLRESTQCLLHDLKMRDYKKLTTGFEIGLGGLAASVVLRVVITGLLHTESLNQANVEAGSAGNTFILFFYVVIAGPIVEEALFRYGLFRALYIKNRFLGYAVSTILFGLSHVWMYVVFDAAYEQLLLSISYMAMGAALALAYEKTGCLMYPLLFHMVYNAYSTVVLILY